MFSQGFRAMSEGTQKHQNGVNLWWNARHVQKWAGGDIWGLGTFGRGTAWQDSGTHHDVPLRVEQWNDATAARRLYRTPYLRFDPMIRSTFGRENRLQLRKLIGVFLLPNLEPI